MPLIPQQIVEISWKAMYKNERKGKKGCLALGLGSPSPKAGSTPAA